MFAWLCAGVNRSMPKRMYSYAHAFRYYVYESDRINECIRMRLCTGRSIITFRARWIANQHWFDTENRKNLMITTHIDANSRRVADIYIRNILYHIRSGLDISLLTGWRHVKGLGDINSIDDYSLDTVTTTLDLSDQRRHTVTVWGIRIAC